MKKLCVVLTVLCMLFAMMAAACAAALPAVGFAAKSDSINGGFEYELTVTLKKALETDLSVGIANNKNDEILTVTIPAGEKQAGVRIPTAVVEEQEKIVYSFAESGEYKGSGKHTLTICRLPRVKFYLDAYLGTEGKSMTVRVHADTPSRVVKGSNVYQLRDTDGTVLAEQAWKNGKNDLYFKFDVTPEMAGRHNFSVWLGDWKVTEADGYGAVRKAGTKVLSNVETDLPLMGVGIDCMYKAHLTDEILAVLDKHGVKATFFMAGHFMRTYPEAVKKIYAAGHEIANHSDTHANFPDLTPAKMHHQLYEPIRLAEELVGVTPRLFRPPYGHYNGDTINVAMAEGMMMIRWSSSFGDSSDTISEKKVMKNATKAEDYQPGNIVLCHLDGKCMPESLEAALTLMEEKGLHVVPISALLYAAGVELPEEAEGRGETLVYTNEYWATWMEREAPELLAQ